MTRRTEHEHWSEVHAAGLAAGAVGEAVRRVAAHRQIDGAALARAYALVARRTAERAQRLAGSLGVDHELEQARDERRHAERRDRSRRGNRRDGGHAMSWAEFRELRTELAVVTAALSVRWADRVAWTDRGEPIDADPTQLDADRVEAETAFRDWLGASAWSAFERQRAAWRSHSGAA